MSAIAVPTCRIFQHGRLIGAPEAFTDIGRILDQEGMLVWFDVVNPGFSALQLLQEEFELHPLAIEDAVHAHQRPKIEAYDKSWFIVVRGASTADTGVVYHEVAIFVGKNYVVTVRQEPPYPLDEIEHRLATHATHLERSASYLLYTILDSVVDDYFPVSDTLKQQINELELELFQGRPPKEDYLPELFRLKRDSQDLLQAVVPMRDILTPIIREDLPLFPREDLYYFRDVYDHAIRITDQLDGVHDLVNVALQIHLSVIGNRQNEVAKQLTIIATIFLPLTFITGFFGQNFSYLVGSILPGPWAFWLLGVGTEVIAIALTLAYFRRKGWF